MVTILTIFHVLICLFLVGVVLLQSGRAGGMGVLSGAATQTVFGGRGAGGFLAQATSVCAFLFLLTSATLAYTSTSARDALARSTHHTAAVTAVPGTSSPGSHPAPTAPPATGTPSAPALPIAPVAPVH